MLVLKKCTPEILLIIFIGIVISGLSCKEQPTEPPDDEPLPPPKQSKWLPMGISDLRIYAIGIDPKNDLRIFVSCLINTPSQTEQFILKTEDGGLSWDTLNLKGSVVEFALDPNNSDILYTAGHFYGGVDADTSTNDALFVKTIDGGNSWMRIENGIGRTFYQVGYDIDVDYHNSNIVYASVYNMGFFKSYNKGLSWDHIGEYFTSLTNLEIDHYNSNILFSFTKYAFIIAKSSQAQIGSQINMSSDGGKTWKEALSVNGLVNDISVSLWNKGEVFAYVSGNDSLSGLIYSRNYGKEWEVKSKKVLADVNLWSHYGRVIYDPVFEDFIYARLKDKLGIFWSSDYGTSWQALSDSAAINLSGISSSGRYLYGTDTTSHGLFRYELK